MFADSSEYFYSGLALHLSSPSFLILVPRLTTRWSPASVLEDFAEKPRARPRGEREIPRFP